MWEVSDHILINYSMTGDILQWENQVFELKELIDHDEYYVVRGIEMSWDEEVEFKIPDCSVLPMMVWA